MTENIIYYTFSTIPQVLGGAIGLLGVFCLFKIQEYNTQLKGWGGMFVLELQRNTKLLDYIMVKDRFLYSQLQKAIEKTHIPDILDALTKIVGHKPTDSFVQQLAIFKSKMSSKSQFVKQTQYCIVYSVVVAIISFIPLPFSGNFTDCGAKTISIIGIELLAVALIWIGRIVYTSLKIDNRKSGEFLD